MEHVYIIRTIRFHNHGADTEEFATGTFFKTEEQAKEYLAKKYGEWMDKDKLYIYQTGLWRFKVGNENGIAFRILEFKAA